MVQALSANFKIRVVDLDQDNIGRKKCEVIIEDVSHTKEILSWADIILATGTTAANNTLPSLLIEKPIIFYGVTISGIAYLMGYEQYCFCSH
jgi:NADH/NAD ratio-sensing transcriptional regulator Rex